MLRSVKRGTLRAAAATGLQAVVRDSAWRRRRLLILCYHGLSLSDEHLWSDLYVTAEHLAARFKILRDSGYNVLPFQEGVHLMYEGSLPPRSVAITFDDGFADFLIKGQPVIQEYAMPTLLYLTTYYVADQKPVFDPLLSYLLWKGRGRELQLPGHDGLVTIPDDRRPREQLHVTVLARGKDAGWTAEEKDAIASDVAEQVGIDMDELRARRAFHIMSAEELAQLDSSLVDVQLHTHRHRTPRDEDLLRMEVRDNRAAIRALFPERPDAVHFCYPSGDYDLRFLEWLRREGVATATTCEHGLASPADDVLLLPRFLDSMLVPEVAFESWLAGTASFMTRHGR